jgi:predicted nucleic-acid-binding protein
MIQAAVLKMLTHTTDALGGAGITVEQPVVTNAAESGKKLRKVHRDLLRHYHSIDSMDALHMAIGILLGCKHFITFDKHWTSVTEVEVLYN